MAAPEAGDPDSGLRRLMNVGRDLVTELDPEIVLERLLEEARRVTGARYAALGVLNEQRTELGRFVYRGIDAATAEAIGHFPRGRGVLGVLVEHPEPLRLTRVGEHAHSFGFPVGHPAMGSFLGVPIMIRGRAWGNLYLTEKEGGGPFTEVDEDAAVVLSEWAATAIENARIHSESERRRSDLERAVSGLDAARGITAAIGTEPDVDRILELIVKRGRALIGARAIIIMLRDGEDLVVSAGAGELNFANVRGRRVSISASTSGEVLDRDAPMRIVNPTTNLRVPPEWFGVSGAESALVVPMTYRGEGIGVLLAFDRGRDREPFSSVEEGMLGTFAQAAANAVTISRSVEADRLRATIAAAEAERRRWARELHDETLQSLGGLRVMLAGALRRDDPEATRATVAEAIGDIEQEIENLRAIITELRPMLLDDLGLGPAIEALVARRRRPDLDISTVMRLPDGDDVELLAPELETTIYRLVQEALTNVVKHARATQVTVAVDVDAVTAVVTITDDGRGFDPEDDVDGFGLAGIRERIYLASGELALTSAPGLGTTLRARFPLSGSQLLRDEAPPERGLSHGVG